MLRLKVFDPPRLAPYQPALEEEDTNQGWHVNDKKEEGMILVAHQGNKWLGDGKSPPLPCWDVA
jgi:hypothetical protein